MMRRNKFKRHETGKLTELISSVQGDENNRLEKKNDFLFVEHWKKGETPFNWRKQWQTLTLEIQSTDGASNGTLHTLDDTHAVKDVILPFNAKISSLNSNTSLRLIENGTSYLSSDIFTEFDVTLNAIDDNHRMGNIFHIDNTLAQFSDMRDAVCISCTVPLSWLDQIKSYASDEKQSYVIELDFNIHCFSKEYEKFSTDPGLHKKYSIEKGGTGYAFLAEYRLNRNSREIG